MKTLQTLANELDFSHTSDYWNYIVDSYINGQFNQCKNLFNAMRKKDQKLFMNWLRWGELEPYLKKEIDNFFTDL